MEPYTGEEADAGPNPDDEQYQLGLECVQNGDHNMRSKLYKEAKECFVTASEIFITLAKTSGNRHLVTMVKLKVNKLFDKIKACNQVLTYPGMKEAEGSTKEEQKKVKRSADEEDVKAVKRTLPSKHSAEITKIVEDSILKDAQTVKWADLVGLEKVKEKMFETIILPIKNPKLFTGLLTPSKGILLYGPPGNGKTMVAKAIASECGAEVTFFNLSGGTITSRYFGDSEKIVQALFDIATAKQPSVIFIDEIDSILGARSSEEHEASRRLKTEFLVKLDGVGTCAGDKVLLIGATNRPFDIDEAIQRRFTARIFLPLPTYDARIQMIKDQTKTANKSISEEEIKEVAERAEGFSFADLKSLCQEAAMEGLRGLGPEKLITLQKEEVPPLMKPHFEAAFKKVTPSVTKKTMAMFEKFNEENASKL